MIFNDFNGFVGFFGGFRVIFNDSKCFHIFCCNVFDDSHSPRMRCWRHDPFENLREAALRSMDF